MISFETEERKTLLDQRWLEVLILVLGNKLGDNIVTGKIKRDFCSQSSHLWLMSGVEVAVRRKMDRLEVWIGNTNNLTKVTDLGRKLKTQLGSSKTKIKFSIHGEEKEGMKGPFLMI